MRSKGYNPLTLAAATEKVVVTELVGSTSSLGVLCGSMVVPRVQLKSAATCVVNFASATNQYGNQSRLESSIQHRRCLMD